MPSVVHLVTPEQLDELVLLVEQAGIGAGNIPEPLLGDLMRSVDTAKSVLTETLDVVAGVRR